MKQTQPSNLIRQFVIRADVDQRLNEIAKKYKIGPQTMLEKMVLDWNQEPPKIETNEPPRPIVHYMSDAMWEVLESGKRMQEQKRQYEEQQRQQQKETKP